MTTTTNNKPASAGGATFLEISGSRKAANSIATVVVWGAMALAMVPLIWVLWELIARGSGVIFSADWWTLSQRGVMNSAEGGGAADPAVDPGGEEQAAQAERHRKAADAQQDHRAMPVPVGPVRPEGRGDHP